MWILGYFLLHLCVYLVFRTQFLIWNWAALKTLSLSQILYAYLNGLRFDLSAISFSVGLFLLGYFWVADQADLKTKKLKTIQKTWFVFFTALNVFFILLNFGDSELINFTARRFTKSSFFLFQEGKVSNLITPYIPMALFTFAFIAGYIFIVRRFYKKQQSLKKSLKVKAAATLVTLLASVVMSRGGLQTKPLTYVDAKIFDNSFANNLVLNSTFTLLKSMGKVAIERTHFFDNEKMISLLNQQDTPTTLPVEIQNQKNKMNVVYVFLESFSKEYTDLKNPEVTPFLNQIKLKGVSFDKAYANGRRSIEGVAALLSGIPALMEEPFINSEFSANQVIGLGTILTANQYHTSFFHGAQNGSMHFDQFTKSVGIENYFGKHQYPNSQDDDGTWGVYDEPFLHWTCEKLSQFKQPFFTSIFTLSSHQPFKVPEKYKEKFQDANNDSLPILKTIQYADYSLEQFMKCAEQQSWYKDTLFIFTADHTGPPLDQNANFESRFKVPLIFYHPNPAVLKNLKANQFAQHIDVLPTLLDVLNIPLKNKNYLARSLWQPADKVIALYADGKYQLVGQVKDEKEQLKAIQQYFSEGLYDNRLYYPSK